MELKYKLLLLLIVSTCLEISNCMVIPELQANGSINIEETEQKSIEIKPLETDFLNITLNDPTVTSSSQASTEVVEPVLEALTNEPDTPKLTESKPIILSDVTTAPAADPLVNNVEESSNQNIKDDMMKPEHYYSKQISNQNQYEKEEIVQPPPTINYEEQIKNIIKEKGSLSDIPDLEIRKTIMTELLDVDYPQNIRPDHSANTIEKTKEIATEEAQTTKPNDESSDIPPVTDSKFDEQIFEKTETSSQKLNENDEAKAEVTLTQSVTEENTNDIDDKLKTNLGLKKKSRQLNFLNLETNSVSGKTESMEVTTTEANSMKNTAEQEVQDKEDDLFFADVIEPSKTQKSVFYLKINTNTPFEILDRDRLVRWMDRQSKSMETNATKHSNDDIEIKEEAKIDATGDSLTTLKQTEEVESENPKDINSNINSSESSGPFSGSDIVSMPALGMPMTYVGAPEIEIQQSGMDVEGTAVSETPIVVNTLSEILELNLLNDNITADSISEDALSGLSPALIDEIKKIQNINLNDSVTEEKGATLEEQEKIETTTQVLNDVSNEHTETKESTAVTPNIIEPVQEKKTKQIVSLDVLKWNSSEESSSESKEHKMDNKTETTKKDSSEENSSESKEDADKKDKKKDDSSEEDSKESKESKSKKNKIKKNNNIELNKQNEKDDSKLNVTDSLFDIAGTTAIIDIRIGSGAEDTNENKTKSSTESASSESSESMENAMPKGRSLDLSAVAAKNMINITLPNHDVYRKSVGEYSDEKNDSLSTSEFSSALQPNPSLKVHLPLFQEKVVPILTFETTTLLPLKVLPKQEKPKEIPPPNPSEMSEIPVDADLLNEILSSDDAIASASIGKASRHIENDNKSIISYLLSSTVVVMIIGILMGTFYKYRGKQGTLNIELEERKNGKNEDNSNDELQEVSISTPSSSDNNSCQSNSLLATSPSIISSENNLLTSNVSSALLNGSQIKINESNVSTIIVSE